MVKLASLNPFSRKAKTSEVARPYRVLFTRGDELMTPNAYRGAFESALARSLTNTSEVADEFVMRAFAVSVTAHICTEYRASKTAGIPLKVVDGLGTELEATPLTHFLKQSPNILQDWARSHLIFGRTYLRKRYNARGYPTELKWINPLDVYEYTERQRVVGYRITNLDGTTENVSTKEIIYTQAFDARPGGNGLSAFEAAWLPLTGEQSLATHSAAFFVNSARPDGFLTFDEPLSPDEYDEARKEWRANFQGVKNSHKTAVMPGGARWTSITIPPNDLAMQELKSIYREDICGIFDVDPILVGLKGTADPLSANSTYGTAETAHIRGVTLPFVETVILPALNDQWALTDFDRRDYYHLEVDTMAIPALVESQLTKADTAIHLSDGHVIDYSESRDLLGFEPREDYLSRKPDEALALWGATAISLNELRSLVGLAPLPAIGNLFNVSGVGVVPIGDLPTLWRNKLLVAPSVYNSEIMTGKPLPQPVDPNTVVPTDAGGQPVSDGAQPMLPGAPPAPALPPGRTDTTRSLFVGLHFPNHPDLIGLQQRLKQSFADQQVEWNEPSDFHTTVLYAPDVEDDQAAAFVRALADLDVPADLALRVGSLNSFDNVGEHALHFRIRRNGELLDTQSELYDVARGLGIGLSAFSDPMAYKPHITMGYCAERPHPVTFQSHLTLTPTALRVMRGDEMLYERSLQPTPTLTRAAQTQPEPMQLEAAISLADNQFVRYSRRILADALSAQGITASWVGEDEWRLVMAQASEWTPAALAALIRSADYAETQHIDVRINGFAQDGDGLYVLVDGSIDPLRKAVSLELRGVGLTSDSAITGVRLATVTQTVDTLPSVDFPIVLNNVSLYLGGQPYHQWTLRSGSAAQFTELKNWEHVTRRKGVTHAFRTETLPRWIADYVQVALYDGDSIDAVFAEARSLLASPRAYSGTRAEFQQEVASLIAAANADESSRQAFAGGLRSTLRRYGLMAYRDGMEDGGYSPESFSADELATFRAWQAESSTYVTNVGAALFKDGVTPDPEFRSELWAAKSLDPIYYAGLKIGAPTKAATWKLGGTIDHCHDGAGTFGCAERDGQTMTVEEWGKIGLPRSSRLTCGGWKCDCDIFDGNGRRIGAR